MSEIKAIIFDIGGVLDKGKWEEHYAPLCNEFGIRLEDFDKPYKKYFKEATIGKISTNEFMKSVGKEINVNPKKLLEVWVKTKKKVLLEDEEVRKIIIKLKKKGYKVASLTNIIELHHKMRIEKNLYNLFEFNICSCVEGVCKPHMKIYALLLNKLKGILPNQIIFVDNKEEYLVPARKFGIKTILFKNANQLTDELKKLGVMV